MVLVIEVQILGALAGFVGMAVRNSGGVIAGSTCGGGGCGGGRSS